jgi:hypothetical protein
VKNDRLITIAAAIVLVFGVMSYFARPKEPPLQLVTPQQELPTYRPTYPGDMSLHDRVLKSYELAFILVRTPYLSTNVNALESIRQWARVQFQAHPDFLHPINLPGPSGNRDTVFGALGYNVFASPLFWLQAQTGELLRWQIARFHETSAYRSFNSSFFDMFGKDADAATLLSRYESERAKEAIDVLFWAAFWLIGAIAGVYKFCVAQRADIFDNIRKLTAGAWAMLAVSYLSQSWETGQAASLISMLAATAIATYLYRPFMLVSHHEAKQQLVRIRLAPCWISMAAWFTVTCLCVQLLTWTRSGIGATADPVTLFLASFTGNFLHDAAQDKRIINACIAMLWLSFTAWALLQRHKDQPYSAEPDDNFKTLERTVTFDRVR